MHDHIFIFCFSYNNVVLTGSLFFCDIYFNMSTYFFKRTVLFNERFFDVWIKVNKVEPHIYEFNLSPE